MSRRFAAAVDALHALRTHFDPDSARAKHQALARVAALPLEPGEALARWHDTLLFLAARPSDARMRRLVDHELARLARALQAGRRQPAWQASLAALENRGLPFVDTASRFSLDCLAWLLSDMAALCRVRLDAQAEPSLSLNDVLRTCLPTLERGETMAGLDADGLFERLGVPDAQRLPFLLEAMNVHRAQPAARDLLFDGLDWFVRVLPRQRRLSLAFNRLPLAPGAKPFDVPERCSRFDPRALMDQPLPAPRPLPAAERELAVQVIKTTMLLTARETDPATYLDPATLRVWDLERGYAVALFGMCPARQLPLESYVGFTLFANGMPVAYGGSWLLGEHALFGMNIFEPYRGGESGFMMCQVLRCYRQAFGLRVVEVDAHQFGLDNADGIASGAYWFYYRHGFRSVDPALAARAEREHRRLAAAPGSRSAEKTLLAFTGSNVMLAFGSGRLPVTVADLSPRVTAWIARRWRGSRDAAQQAADAGLCQRLGWTSPPTDPDERRVFGELALLAMALPIDDAEQLQLLRHMVAAKPRDLEAYQRLSVAFFSRLRARAAG